MGKTITVSNLTIKYNDRIILKDFSYTFEASASYVIMGSSGVGKTSLLNAIMGLIPFSGTVNMDKNTLISSVFQENRLIENISPFKNISLCASPSYSKKEILAIMDTAGLTGYSHKKTATLSGGMKRRVAILRALLAPKDILIMDEPFTGLDSANKSIMKSLIKSYAANSTIITVTHNIDDISNADTILLNMS